MEFSNAGQAAAITRTLHEAGATGVRSEYWDGTVVIEARFADLEIVRNVLLAKGYEARMDSDSLAKDTVWITVTDRPPTP